MGDQVFRVMLRMEIKPGMGEQFERVWTEVGNVITDHPANLGQWLLKNAEDENVYHIMSDWVDEPRFREFETSAQHLEHRTKLHPYRSGGSMTTAHIVVQLEGAGAGVAGR